MWEFQERACFQNMTSEISNYSWLCEGTTCDFLENLKCRFFNNSWRSEEQAPFNIVVNNSSSNTWTWSIFRWEVGVVRRRSIQCSKVTPTEFSGRSPACRSSTQIYIRLVQPYGTRVKWDGSFPAYLTGPSRCQPRPKTPLQFSPHCWTWFLS